MAKPFAKKFYSSKQWQDCRNAYAERVHHLCENCLARGIYKPGEIVHHMIELDPVTIENPEISLNPDNLQMLCRDCHADVHDLHGGQWAAVNARKKRERASKLRYIVGKNGEITPNGAPSGNGNDAQP